jgi:hypothetical protein
MMADYDAEESKADISSLLEVNRLDYRLPPSLSIATSRAMKVYRSMQSSYVAGTDQLQFTLASGSTYVDFLNSFVKFKVKMPDVLDPKMNPKFSPHTGWAQMIQQVRVVHSSGVELDRVKNSVGEYIQIQDYYNCSESKRRTQGSMYSLNDTGRPGALIHPNELIERAKEGLNTPSRDPLLVRNELPGQGDYLACLANEAFDTDLNPQGRTFDVAIPLSRLLGMFDVDLLAPSFLAAGLQIHIDMYKPEHFFVCDTGRGGATRRPGDNGKYQRIIPDPADETKTITEEGTPWSGQLLINNCELHLETFTLTDSIVRKLSQISASSGLEWYFDALHQSDGSPGSQSDYTMQITRALSRANNVIVKCRTLKHLSNTFEDSYGSQVWYRTVEEGGGTQQFKYNEANGEQDGNMIAFQVQLGAQYIPSRSLREKKEFVHSAFKTFSQYRRGDGYGGPDDVQFSGFRTTREFSEDTADNVQKGLAISCVPLESSSTLQQSGAAISAQRTAVVNMAWGPSSGVGSAKTQDRKVDVFVVYSKLATLFLDSVVVRS